MEKKQWLKQPIKQWDDARKAMGETNNTSKRAKETAKQKNNGG